MVEVIIPTIGIVENVVRKTNQKYKKIRRVGINIQNKSPTGDRKPLFSSRKRGGATCGRHARSHKNSDIDRWSDYATEHKVSGYGSGGNDEISIEETNKLRASLGLSTLK